LLMDSAFAHDFAQRWVDDWNSHDLSRILSHYADDIVFLSPIAQRLLGDGRVARKDALRAYWTRGLAANPTLKFELKDVLVGHQCLTILYGNHRGQAVAETVEFNAENLVVRSCACYSQ
jgi:ketosteroid isomerase-like protein